MWQHIENLRALSVFIALHKETEVRVEDVTPILRPYLRHVVLTFRQAEVNLVDESSNRAVNGVLSMSVDIHSKELHSVAHWLEVDFILVALNVELCGRKISYLPRRFVCSHLSCDGGLKTAAYQRLKRKDKCRARTNAVVAELELAAAADAAVDEVHVPTVVRIELACTPIPIIHE